MYVKTVVLIPLEVYEQINKNYCFFLKTTKENKGKITNKKYTIL
jgi:hypothetical protein